jgi:MoaA/NifB/PqqE/SkfB family radical SAM enzyme
MRLGIMITNRCDFTCRHCMFSCDIKGKHMSDEVIDKVSEFIENNNIDDINIYGGEPFYDITHFLKCMDKFYGYNRNFFISTNGSFLGNSKRLKAVEKWCRDTFRHNKAELSNIRISDTIFHKENWSANLKAKMKEFGHACNTPECYEDWFEREYDEYYVPPFEWSEPRDHFGNFIFYIDNSRDNQTVNPSGRAIAPKTYCYADKKKLHCFLTSTGDEGYEPQIYPNGNIGICCYCKSGTIGNIMDYTDYKEIMRDIDRFRDKFRKRGHLEMDQLDRCDTCRKMKIYKRRKKI